MAGLVVKALVFLQKLQHGCDAHHKHQIGAQNNQNHSHKEQGQRGHGVGDANGQIVPGPQQARAQNRQNPVALGLFFAYLPAVEKLNGFGEPDLQNVVAAGKQEDASKNQDRVEEHHRRDHKGNGHRRAA